MDNTSLTSGTGQNDPQHAAGAGASASAGAAGSSGDAAAKADPAAKFDISESVKAQYPDLVPLILATESMTDEERQYWFQILPIMTAEQVAKLREILANEKKQLEQIDSEYEDELKKINEKHAGQWKAFESTEKRKKLQQEEAQSEKSEKSEEEDLLKKLQNL